jgi:hypothetical protein
MEEETTRAVLALESNQNSTEPACEAESRYEAPTILHSTEFGEHYANTQTETSSNIFQHDKLEDVIYVDSVQEEKHDTWANNNTILLQLGLEEEITRAAITFKSNQNSTEPVCEAETTCKAPMILQVTEFDEQDNHANIQTENSPNILQHDSLEDVVYIDSVQEDEHVSWANNDASFDSTLPEPSSCKWIDETVDGNIS